MIKSCSQVSEELGLEITERRYMGEEKDVPVNPGLSQTNIDAKYPDSIGAEFLSIALIGPDEERRKELEIGRAHV